VSSCSNYVKLRFPCYRAEKEIFICAKGCIGGGDTYNGAPQYLILSFKEEVVASRLAWDRSESLPA